MHEYDVYDIIDILVRETIRYADQKIAQKADDAVFCIIQIHELFFTCKTT